MPHDDHPVPVRTEIEVLPADDPKARKLGWTVREYNGCPIHPGPPGMTVEQVIESGLPEGFELARITDAEVLQDGDVVLAPAMFGGLNVGTVGTHEDGSRYFVTPGGFLGFLSFGEDDRNCWVSWGGGNLNAIKKLSL